LWPGESSGYPSIDESGTAPLQLNSDSPVTIGDTVYVVGNPEGLEGTFSQGIISGIRAQGESEILQITAPISSGSSGGPVLNRNGQVIGVAVGVWKVGQNLNGSAQESVTTRDLMGILIFENSDYTQRDERERLDQSSGVAGIPGLSARNR
jgi:S1-C subfamily serine protease